MNSIHAQYSLYFSLIMEFSTFNRSLIFVLLSLSDFIVLPSTLGSLVVFYFHGAKDSWTSPHLCRKGSSWVVISLQFAVWQAQRLCTDLRQGDWDHQSHEGKIERILMVLEGIILEEILPSLLLQTFLLIFQLSG